MPLVCQFCTSQFNKDLGICMFTKMSEGPFSYEAAHFQIQLKSRTKKRKKKKEL